MTIYDYMGLAAGLLISSASFPQLIKIIKTKSVEDLSSYVFIIQFISLLLWFGYSFHYWNWILIITCGIQFVICTTILLFIRKYKNISTNSK